MIFILISIIKNIIFFDKVQSKQKFMIGLSQEPNSIFSRVSHSQELNKQHDHLQTLPYKQSFTQKHYGNFKWKINIFRERVSERETGTEKIER